MSGYPSASGPKAHTPTQVCHNHRIEEGAEAKGFRGLQGSSEDRLIARMRVSPLGCWEWTGATHRGYGNLSHEGRSEGAHRVAWMLWVGPIPEGLELDHLCRNRGCFNPAHLEPVTHYENVMRGEVGAVKYRTHCIHGHALTAANTYFDQGKRRCRECNAARQRRFYAKRKAAA